MKKYFILPAIAVLAVVGLILTNTGKSPDSFQANLVCDPQDPLVCWNEGGDLPPPPSNLPDGAGCAVASECASQQCNSNRCGTPVAPQPKPDGQACSAAAECTSNVCSNGICGQPVNNTTKKADGQSCTDGPQCTSNFCDFAHGSVCAPAGGGWTGGTVGTKTAGQACAAASECAVGLSCTGNVCTNPTNQNQGLGCWNTITNQAAPTCTDSTGTQSCPTFANGYVCQTNNTQQNTTQCPSGQQKLCPNEPMRCVTTSAECTTNTNTQICPSGTYKLCGTNDPRCVRTATECTTQNNTQQQQCQPGQYWDFVMSACKTNPTNTQQQYDPNTQQQYDPNTQYDQNSQWDPWSANMFGAAPETMTQQDWFSGSKCGEKALNMDPFCYGNHPDAWNWKEGCVDSK
ncbi:hypothetical protein HZA38_01340, partial [Candidatus Peregrinibacteria bacterium]|nr:hypothetical protein [Candidatus Peregrinibacteria bacterium]